MKCNPFFAAAVLTAIAIHSAPAAPGDLDLTFGGTGKVTTHFNNGIGQSMAIQSDGKIVVAGSSGSGGATNFALARYNVDGSLDTSFSGNGTSGTDFGGFDDTIKSVAIQSDGKIVVAGYSATNTPFGYNFAVARYNADGSLDTSFNHTGKLTTNFGVIDNRAQSVAVQDDGKIVVAGYAGNSPFDEVLAVARFNTDGSLDTSFNGGGKVFTNAGNLSARGQSVAIQSDGKIVVAGSSLRSNASNYDFALVRFNENGSLDFQGSTAIGTGNDYGSSVVIQNDGTIVVAGYTFKGSSYDFALASGPGKVSTNVGGLEDRAYGIAIESDGKIIVAGYSDNGSDNDFALVRYNANLSLDTTFGDGGTVMTDFGGSDDFGYGMALQDDGKIVIAGYTVVGGNADFALARYEGGAAVPESSTFALLGLVVPALLGASRRRQPDRMANGSRIAS